MQTVPPIRRLQQRALCCTGHVWRAGAGRGSRRRTAGIQCRPSPIPLVGIFIAWPLFIEDASEQLYGSRAGRAWQTPFGSFAPLVEGKPQLQATMQGVLLQLPMTSVLQSGGGLAFVLRQPHTQPEWLQSADGKDLSVDFAPVTVLSLARWPHTIAYNSISSIYLDRLGRWCEPLGLVKARH